MNCMPWCLVGRLLPCLSCRSRIRALLARHLRPVLLERFASDGMRSFTMMGAPSSARAFFQPMMSPSSGRMLVWATVSSDRFAPRRSAPRRSAPSRQAVPYFLRMASMLSPSRMPFGVVIFIGFPLLVASCVPHPDEWMGLSGWHWSRTDAVLEFRTPL